MPRHVIEAAGDGWVKIDTIVTNGPYKPVDWVPGSHVTSEKQAHYYDAANVKIDGAKFFVLERESQTHSCGHRIRWLELND